MRAAAIALAALVLPMLAASPAAAEFRYVPEAAERGAGDTRAGAAAGPPGGVAATPAEAGQADPAPGPGPLLSGTRVWRVHAGETLRAVLSRWGARADAKVTFLTDRRYRLDAAVAFQGSFPDAVEALLKGLTHLPHPPEGSISGDGGRLAITHRTRTAGGGESKP